MERPFEDKEPVAPPVGGEQHARLPAKAVTLDDLVSRITAENIHGETDWGAPAGREVW